MRHSSLVAVLALVAGLVWVVPAGAHHAGLPHATDDPSADPRSFVMPGGLSSVTPPTARLRAQAVRRSSRPRAAGAAPRGLALNLTGALELEPSSGDAHADVAAFRSLAFVGKWSGPGCPGTGVDIVYIARPDAPRRSPTPSTTRAPPWRTCRPCASAGATCSPPGSRPARPSRASRPGWPASSCTTSPTRPRRRCSASCPRAPGACTSSTSPARRAAGPSRSSPCPTSRSTTADDHFRGGQRRPARSSTSPIRPGRPSCRNGACSTPGASASTSTPRPARGPTRAPTSTACARTPRARAPTSPTGTPA